MLRTRILTALVGIPLFLGLLYYGGLALLVLVAISGAIGYFEYARMWRAKGVEVAQMVGTLSCLALFAWAYFTPPGHPLSQLVLGTVMTLSVLVTLIWQILRFGERSMLDAVISVGGVFYVGWLWSHLVLLRGMEQGLLWVGMAFFCTWAADTGAYFAGRAFGKHKMAPKVSPSKSWEGLIGGVLLAAVVGTAWAAYVLGENALFGAGLGIVIALVAAVGDLAESSLKRYCGVKDSGTLLPGHGGVLDRFDSSLFVLPVVYYLSHWLYL